MCECADGDAVGVTLRNDNQRVLVLPWMPLITRCKHTGMGTGGRSEHGGESTGVGSNK